MYATLTRKASRCRDAKKTQGYVVRTCRLSPVFQENSNLKSGTEINLSFIVNEDTFDERRRVILQKVFLKITFLTLFLNFGFCVKVECKELSEKVTKMFISFAASFFV